MEAPPPPPPLLPQDAIVEILSRLPVKPLVRFKCLSTSYKSIISAPNFVKLHYQRSPKNSYTLLTLQGSEEIDVCALSCPNRSLLNFPPSTISPHPSHPLLDEFTVLGSCNGLVCLSAPAPFFHLDSQDSRDEAWFRFWNPAARVISLSSPTVAGLMNSNFGFGYDEFSDSYKVVAILDDSPKPNVVSSGIEFYLHKYKVKVYTMGDTRWRDIGRFPALPVLGSCYSRNDGVYLRGNLNWFAVTDFNLGNDWELDDDITLDRLIIVSLDLGHETYKQVLLPDGLDELPRSMPVLGVLRDCMCLSHDYRGTYFVLWQMTEFGVSESWTQLLSVSFLDLQALLPAVEDYPLEPVCISDDGDVVVLTSNDDMELIRYNCRDNMVEHAAIPDQKIWTHPKDYIESLVQPLPLPL